jgi:hypothetical protein
MHDLLTPLHNLLAAKIQYPSYFLTCRNSRLFVLKSLNLELKRANRTASRVRHCVDTTFRAWQLSQQ